jgi:hypothetical protein
MLHFHSSVFTVYKLLHVIHDFKQNDFHEAASVLLAILPPHS